MDLQLKEREVGNLSASLPGDAALAPHLPMSASMPLQQPEVQARQRDKREENAKKQGPRYGRGDTTSHSGSSEQGQHFKAKRDPSLPS